VYLEKKQYARAAQLFRDVIKRYAKTVGHAFIGEKQYRDAEVELSKGYEILKKQTDSSVTWLRTARKDLVIAYTALHQNEKASSFQHVLKGTQMKGKARPFDNQTFLSKVNDCAMHISAGAKIDQ
jgi:hypothetical protein